MLMTVNGTKLVIGQVGDGIVAINAADGKHVWETLYEGGGSRYKAATPIITGDTLIYLDGPARAVKLAKEGDKFVSSKRWSHQDSRVEHSTPVLKDGRLYGLSSRGELFCVDTKDGKALWSSAVTPQSAAPPLGGDKGKGKGGGRMGGGNIFGSIVDADPVLLAVTPGSQLVVFEPSDKELKKLATYKIGDKETHAHPIVTGNRIY